MAIIEPVDVERLANRTFSEDETSLVEKLIEDFQAELEAYLNRSIEIRTFTEQHVVEDFGAQVFLYNTPVLSILSVTLDGYPLTTDYYGVTKNGLNLTGYGVVWPGSATRSWPTAGSRYEITYVGGLDGQNEPVLQSILARTVLHQLALTKQGDAAMTGVIRMQVEDFMWQKSDQAASGFNVSGAFTEPDLKVLSRYRRRRFV